MIAPSSSRRITGMTSRRGTADMITPAACTLVWRFSPSSPLANSKTFLASGSSSRIFLNSAASLYLLFISVGAAAAAIATGSNSIVSSSKSSSVGSSTTDSTTGLSFGSSTISRSVISFPRIIGGMALVSFSPTE